MAARAARADPSAVPLPGPGTALTGPGATGTAAPGPLVVPGGVTTVRDAAGKPEGHRA
ncbi:hypothetical protein SHO565_61130 [Streptomyces sp. HO565]